jgi:hypothetical protein
MATMVELDLASIEEQRRRRKAREDRARTLQKQRVAQPQPAPLEDRKLLRAERAKRMPEVRAERLETTTARVSRAERIRRLEAEVERLKAAASKR